VAAGVGVGVGVGAGVGAGVGMGVDVYLWHNISGVFQIRINQKYYCGFGCRSIASHR